ncbi:MAG: type II secretion system protein [Gemmatimonadota bacterium]|nr:type II secretion system protein [Gemmatimonadota bacterium]
MPRHATAGSRTGFTLVEMVIVIVLSGLLLAAVLPASGIVDRWSLSRAARVTERHLAGVRLRAVARRERLRVRVSGPGTLETVDPAGRVIERRALGPPGARYVDSIVVRPRTLGFNPRGHGAAGSVYLYRGDRGIRVVINFVGRIRRHAFRP